MGEVIERGLSAAAVRWLRVKGQLTLRRSGVEGRPAAIGAPVIQLHPGSWIRVGQKSVLISDSRWTALGVAHPVVLRTLRAGAKIDIGEDVGMSGASVCAALSVRMGDRSLIGADAIIVDTDFHPLRLQGRRGAGIPEPDPADRVDIGADVFIGARAIVLKGVSIGEGSVIGAGSVVTRDVPAGCVAAGNPARVVSRLPAQ